MVCSVKAALRSACWIFCILAHEPKKLDEDCRLLPFRLIRPAVCEMAVRDAYSRPPDENQNQLRLLKYNVLVSPNCFSKAR